MNTRKYLAEHLVSFEASKAVALADRVADWRAKGRDIIGLNIGEPDFPTPEHIRVAAVAALHAGATRYTVNAGRIDLREAISRKLRSENKLTFAPEQIIVTAGAKQALYEALMVSLEPGDEVVIPAPYWVTYPAIVALARAQAIILPSAAADGYKLSAASLRASLTERTRWLILNSPGNPSGAVYSAKDLRAIADVLLDYPQVLILSDEIYEHIVFGGVPSTHLLLIEPRLYPRCVVVNGFSKAYAMTGWRIGYAAGPLELIRGMDALQSHSTSNACSISQAAALAALEGSQAFRQEWNTEYLIRRDLALEILEEAHGLQCFPPAGTFYLWIDCKAWLGLRTREGSILRSDLDIVNFLLEKAEVAVLPGIAFGMEAHVRLSLATARSLLIEGCKRIVRAANTLCYEGA